MTTISRKIAGLMAAGGLLAGAVALGPGIAQAATANTGTVTTSSLAVRYGPNTASTKVGAVERGLIPIDCWLRGNSVDGNDRWYALPPTLNEYVSARYVRVVGSVPECGTSSRTFTGKTTVAVRKRTGPTTAASQAGSVAKGQRVTIECKIPGQKVGGNANWYYLSDGRWLPARYVSNVGAAPQWCN